MSVQVAVTCDRIHRRGHKRRMEIILFGAPVIICYKFAPLENTRLYCLDVHIRSQILKKRNSVPFVTFAKVLRAKYCFLQILCPKHEKIRISLFLYFISLLFIVVDLPHTIVSTVRCRALHRLINFAHVTLRGQILLR